VLSRHVRRRRRTADWKIGNKSFSTKIDEATDCNGIGHLIAYVWYVEDTTINEDMLFCKPIKRSTAKELFKILLDSMKGGLQTLIKRSALYDTSWITGCGGIMPRIEWSNGYSGQNCKLHVHKESSIENQAFCRIVLAGGGTVAVTSVLL
jgi:hypothetical protein